MRIFLTNDDGYTSPGITLLADSLRNAGHRVFLAAPDKDRSGTSHAIDFLNHPIKLTNIDTDTWSCSGTPVDCVIVSLLGGIQDIDISTGGVEFDMKNAPDLILSGINIGANLGTDIIYSGTAAAARQGSFFGIPSIALSLVKSENGDKWHWEKVVSYIAKQLEVFISYWKPGSFVNINFPNIDKYPENVVHSFPSMRYYSDRIVTYTAPEGGTFCFSKSGKVNNEPADGSDWAEVKKGNAALSVVSSQPVIFKG
ncbi:MAG: 5'/3'-nucleotidase SurE [Treponema sp.]|nr:5'/3'-nucleotidase SurE [Treponema sp.]